MYLCKLSANEIAQLWWREHGVKKCVKVKICFKMHFWDSNEGACKVHLISDNNCIKTLLWTQPVFPNFFSNSVNRIYRWIFRASLFKSQETHVIVLYSVHFSYLIPSLKQYCTVPTVKYWLVKTRLVLTLNFLTLHNY